MSEPYELGPEIAVPALPGRAVVKPDADEAIDAIAADIFVQAQSCVRAFGDFHFAVTPGALQHRLYVRMMVDPQFRGLPWARTHLWIADTGEDGASGFGEIRELLVEQSGIPASQAHPIRVDRSGGDLEYEEVLREHLGWREPGHDRLDFVVLAMDGGGVAAAHREDDGRLVLSDEAGRVSMTLRMINASRAVGVMAVGSERAGAIEEIVRTGACAIEPVGGELMWYLDEAAAGQGGEAE